jgi:ribosomal protein L31E
VAEEKIVTINLRKKLLKKARWKRNKIAISRIREMIKRISKAEKVVFEKKLSNKIFSKPISKIRIRTIKIDDKSVRAELVE